jgi:hypothetical protein
MSLLQQLLQELSELQGTGSGLGFGTPPTPKFIYANVQDDCLWYFWDHTENKAIPITGTALTGYIRGVQISVQQYKGEDKPKLRVRVEADEEYIIQAGIDTVFARSFLSFLAGCPQEDLKEPVTIAVKASEDSEKVLFVEFYSGRNKHFNPWNRDTVWEPVIEAAIANVAQANGRESGASATEDFTPPVDKPKPESVVKPVSKNVSPNTAVLQALASKQNLSWEEAAKAMQDSGKFTGSKIADFTPEQKAEAETVIKDTGTKKKALFDEIPF